MEDALETTTFSFSPNAPAPDRRSDRRYLTILRVGTLIVDGHRELCLVRNISSGGLMAHVYSALDEGQPVQIEIKTNSPIGGHIAWVREANVGVAFDAPICVEDILAPQSAENGWRPRLPRVDCDRLARLRIGARTLWVGTCDISQGGVKVETATPLSPGEDVVLTFDGLPPISGVIRWCNHGHAGISFNQVLPFRELMQWLRGD